MDEQGNIIIYQSEDGAIRLDVRLESNTVWLTQQQMADLFGSSRTNVVEHIKHIYEDEELNEETTCRRFRQVRQERNREVSLEIPFYNLDMIISVGYRSPHHCRPRRLREGRVHAHRRSHRLSQP